MYKVTQYDYVKHQQHLIDTTGFAEIRGSHDNVDFKDIKKHEGCRLSALINGETQWFSEAGESENGLVKDDLVLCILTEDECSKSISIDIPLTTYQNIESLAKSASVTFNEQAIFMLTANDFLEK